MICDSHGYIGRLIHARLHNLIAEIERLKFEKSILENDTHLLDEERRIRELGKDVCETLGCDIP